VVGLAASNRARWVGMHRRRPLPMRGSHSASAMAAMQPLVTQGPRCDTIGQGGYSWMFDSDTNAKVFKV
jgi:hypothetical protein